MPESPTLLWALVTQRHWRTHATFALQFRYAAGELADRERDERLRSLSVSPRQFERWLNGSLKTQPYPDQCRVLEHLFGRPVAELLAPATEPEEPRGQTERIERGAAMVGRNHHDVHGVKGQVEMAARRALRFALAAESTNTGQETVDQLTDEVRRLAAAYPREPLPALFGDLVELQDVVFRLLEGRQRPNLTRDLYLLAGIASGMLAKASHDLGNPHAAMTQARAAYVCADNAGHHALRVWVRGLQALAAYWAGWPHEAIRYAQLGAEFADVVSGTAAAWLPALEARARAALGDGPGARDAITRADAARDRVVLDDLDQLGGLLSFPGAKQLYYAAEAMVLVPEQSERAERMASDAVAALEHADPSEWAFGDEAGARSGLALSRARRGELEGADDALQPVLGLPPEQRIHGIVTSALRVHESLRDPRFAGSPDARELQEKIEAFCQIPLSTLPR
ncbi:MAG: XRE family transcriptional regulator [Egibacteraceae bacterium]